MKVIFITEGGKKYGFGHISRCIALYDAFKELKFKPELFINGDEAIKPFIKNKKVKLFNWIKKKDDLFKLLLNASIIIVDSYIAPKSMYDKIAALNTSCLFLDDTNRISYPKGIVVNGAIFAEDMNYPEEAEITYLLGSHYTLLQKPFWNVPPKNITNKIENILITMGGADAGNLTAQIIQCIRDGFPDLKINVTVGRSFKGFEDNQKQKSEYIKLIYDAGVVEMKNLMAETDIAISSSGQTLFELARMGVPAIAIQTAENQKYNIDGWKKAGFIEYAGDRNDKHLLQNILDKFIKLSDKNQRQLKSEIGQKWMDGKGAIRIADFCINALSP